jgi:hypothetical protein
MNPATLLPLGDRLAEDFDTRRVASLPRREPSTDELVEALSAHLRLYPHTDVCPVCHAAADDCDVCSGTGRIRLRPEQALALRELFEMGGLVAPMRVGSGKTLVTMLAPTLLGAALPVLVLPASMFRKSPKTQRDFARYRRAWNVRLPKLISYEELSRPDKERLLFDEAPDLLMLDEAHKARNRDNVAHRRIERYKAETGIKVSSLSGTLITGELLDVHAHAVWALDDAAPVPKRRVDAERWSSALGTGGGAFKSVDPGPLGQLPGGYWSWFRGSRGVVPTPGSDCTAEIRASWWDVDLPEALQRMIASVNESNQRPDSTPDDPIILDEFERVDCLCQLALGFYYVWDPMPPDWWLTPRRAWSKYVRAVLDERLEGFDSPSMIRDGLRGRHQPPAADYGVALWSAWSAVKDRFEPNPVPVWADPSPLGWAAQAAGDGTLIWVRYKAAGRFLERCGVPYYPGGTDPEQGEPGRTMALSISSHGTGRNLQKWHKNLILTPMASPDLYEQLIGRTHRAGQRSNVVDVRIIRAIDYHEDVVRRAITKARADSRASGFAHKLTDAQWSTQ